ncbi:MAG: PKD domain-containing protein, partial [Candidatus Latescibacterota bacterium]
MTEPRFSRPMARLIRIGVVACSLLGMLAVTRVWTGCDGDSPAGPTQGTGSLSVSLVWPTARTAGALYDTLSVTISGGGMDPIARDFPITPEAMEVSWQISDVPVGDRTVAIVVVGRTTPGGPRQRLYEGSVSVTVAEGRTAAAAVPVQPVALVVHAGTLQLSTAVLSVGDTLVARVVDASTSHTAPAYRWDWGDGSSTNWNRSSSAGHAYPAVGQYEVRASVGDSISPSLAPQTLTATVTVHRRNQPPVARAGQDQWVALGAEVHLDGSGSDPESDVLTYQWVQLSGPTANLAPPNSPSPVFVAASQGVYQFSFTVRDSALASLPDTVVVSVLAFAAVVPDTISAHLTAGRIALDGSASYPRDGTLVYHWRQVRSKAEVRPEYRALLARFVGISVLGTLSDNDSDAADRVSFEPIEGCGLYVFTLAVESRQTATWNGPDTVYVLVRSAPPTVFVDAPAQAVAGDTVLLRATATDDLNELAYRWRGSSAAQLSDTTAPNPTFTPSQAGQFRFTVVAVDGDPQESEPCDVVVSVMARPSATNHPPVADAGPDQVVHAGDTVNLDGSGSSDPDTGDVLSYAWAVPAGVTLSSTTMSRPTFTAGGVGIYRFGLVVSDGRTSSSADSVVVTVANRTPTANAGDDQAVSAGAIVQLDGTGSRDLDGDALSYTWTAPAGVTLSSLTASRPTFTAGGMGSYEFGLVVSDGRASSAADSVVVMVQAPDRVPPDLTVSLPGGATMDFMWIAPGAFTMGDADLGEPPHQVTLTQGFYLGQYEIMQGQWQAVMGTTPWAGQQYV